MLYRMRNISKISRTQYRSIERWCPMYYLQFILFRMLYRMRKISKISRTQYRSIERWCPMYYLQFILFRMLYRMRKIFKISRTQYHSIKRWCQNSVLLYLLNLLHVLRILYYFTGDEKAACMMEKHVWWRSMIKICYLRPCWWTVDTIN